MPLSSRLELPYLEPAQAQKHVTHNEALRQLDMLVQLSVQGFDQNTPPALPVTGQVFALGAAPTGDWAGQAGMLALRETSGWMFQAPQPGWSATLAGSAEQRIWDGTTWQIAAGQSQNLPGLGVNTSSDATNRLAVSAAATLLTHEGTDHRLVLNKASDTDTASLLFQSNWTGHAEMGLAGDTGFSVKVSPDGTTWTQALTLSADGQSASGAIMQAAPSDQTPGKLMQTGAFGLGGTALSLSSGDDLDAITASGFYFNPSAANTTGNHYPVSAAGALVVVYHSASEGVQSYTTNGSEGAQSYSRSLHGGGWSPWRRVFGQTSLLGGVAQSGGIPTGAVIETGSNANGNYIRWADGTQICTETSVTVAGGDTTWVFPAAFASTTRLVTFGAGRTSTNASFVSFRPPTVTSVAHNHWANNGTRLSGLGIALCAIGRWF